jgi:hypothetical protein
VSTGPPPTPPISFLAGLFFVAAGLEVRDLLPPLPLLAVRTREEVAEGEEEEEEAREELVSMEEPVSSLIFLRAS